MALSLGICDIPALTKLSWELYNQCHPVARDAPDGFHNLVTELASLQGTLRVLSDDVSSNSSFFEKMNGDRKRTFDRCLNACASTLQRLQDLVAHYRELGMADGKQFWQKMNWNTQRVQIADIRSRIMVHTCNLNLCMSLIGDASLARIEQSMLQAMEEDAMLNAETPTYQDEYAIFPSSSREIVPFLDFEKGDEANVARPLRPRMSAQRNPTQATGPPRHVSNSSGSNVSVSDGSLWSEAAPISPMPPRSFPQTMMGRVDHSPSRSDQLLFDGSVDGRTLARSIWENSSDLQEKQSMEKPRDSPKTEFGHSSVMEAVTSAMQQLRQIRLQEQLSRPIRYEPQDQSHVPSPEIVKKFESSVNDELRIRRLNTRDWLQVATWWLLKARATLANCNRHHFVSARGSLSPSTDSRSTSHQAYADILKASYILYYIVLRDESSPALLTDENRKSIAELSEGVNEELSQYTSLDIPEPSNLLSQNLDIWEPLQPEEAANDKVDFSFDLENTRWIAVDQDDAGSEEETVLYRTFVNAGIGSKKFRMRTKRAPYMLLLAIRDGESEPKIILCNQSGSLGLERNFVPDDLPPLIRLSNAYLTSFPGTRVSEPLPFKFDNMSVSISFQFEVDLGHFINIPKAYFDAVWQREPVDSTEFTESVIFKSSVEMFEQLKPPNMKPMNPPVALKSCEVRILERSFGEAWRSIRRMVISSSAAEKTPGVIEFFMPLSRVQLSREDVSRQVLLKWSDTCQERSDKTDGNYNQLHSYVYDSNAPNIGIGLHFRTQQGAEDFEKAVLELNFRPDFAWSQPSSSGCMYDVVDTGTEHKQYKAVVLFQSRSSWRYSNLYYLYRDTDYAYSHYSLNIRFPRIYYTDYISTHVDQLYPADSPVLFSHCEKKASQIIIEFSNEPVARSFLGALSPLHELVFSRRVHSLSTKSTSLFGAKKSGKGGTELQLWRRGTSFQLASRWDDSVSDKWFTMCLPDNLADCSKESTRVSFPRLPYVRGSTIDMMNLMARNTKTSNIGQKEAAVSIVFQSVQDREDFLAVLQGKPVQSFI